MFIPDYLDPTSFIPDENQGFHSNGNPYRLHIPGSSYELKLKPDGSDYEFTMNNQRVHGQVADVFDALDESAAADMHAWVATHSDYFKKAYGASWERLCHAAALRVAMGISHEPVDSEDVPGEADAGGSVSESLFEDMSSDWQKITAMDHGSSTGTREEMVARQNYLSALYSYQNKYGKDATAVRDRLAAINDKLKTATNEATKKISRRVGLPGAPKKRTKAQMAEIRARIEKLNRAPLKN